MTSHNQEAWLEQALDSVAMQTEKRLQVIITDDGSTDRSTFIAQRWLAEHDVRGTLVASEVNLGLPAMLNRAARLFEGEYVVVLNGDDWMEPKRVAVQADALAIAPSEVGLVYSDLREVDLDGQPTGGVIPPAEVERVEGRVLARLVEAPFIGMPAVMFRRSVLDVVGLWDEALVADDFDFLLRVAAAGYEFRYVPGIAVNYRRYHGSMTGGRGAVLADGRIRALERLLGRDSNLDTAILKRVAEIALALHASRYDRRVTRRHLRFVLRRRPTRRIARAAMENILHLPPGYLSLHRWISGGRAAAKSAEPASGAGSHAAGAHGESAGG